MRRLIQRETPRHFTRLLVSGHPTEQQMRELFNFSKETQPLKRREVHITQQSDEQLATRYREHGEQEVMGELFKRYGHLVLGVCLKYLKNKALAEDMVITTFEKLMTDLRKREVDHFKSWLHTVTKNNCLMYLRKHNKLRDKHTDIEIVDPYLAAEEYSNEKEVLESKLNHLEAAMEELKPEQQQCVRLFYLDQKCYQEVADATGYTMKQVKSYIQNGKRNLKMILLKKNEFSVR